MLDVKSWLETTGMEVAENHFKKPPALPYVVFLESGNYGGADSKNCIADRSITIELYSDKINETAEAKIEALLNDIAKEYLKDRIWIDSERRFQTMYDFNLLEKF